MCVVVCSSWIYFLSLWSSSCTPLLQQPGYIQWLILINVICPLSISCGGSRYDILGMHEFDSVRKRMSVLVEGPDESIKLLVKGADSSVMSIISQGENGDSLAQIQRRAEISSATLAHLDRYSRDGLRTLVVASKELSHNEVSLKSSSEVGEV